VQLFLRGEVVADVPVVQGETLLLGILDADGDGNRRSTAITEYISRLLLTLHPGSTCITPKVEHIQVREILGHRQTDAIAGVTVEPTAIRYESDHTLIADSISGPTERTQVGVV